ncbi:MAG: TIM barrel protein [Bryobacteraceae bacterium]
MQACARGAGSIWEYLARLVHLAADIAPGSVLALRSGKQRSAVVGASVSDAIRRLRDGLVSLAPEAEKAGVTVLLEPLAPHLCNLVNTLAEAVAIAQQIASPAVSAMFEPTTQPGRRSRPQSSSNAMRAGFGTSI